MQKKLISLIGINLLLLLLPTASNAQIVITSSSYINGAGVAIGPISTTSTITDGGALNLTNTSTDGIILTNTTAAAVGIQQYSPRIRFTGNGWKTNATAASQQTDFTMEVRPIQDAANPEVVLYFTPIINGVAARTPIYICAATTGAPIAANNATQGIGLDGLSNGCNGAIAGWAGLGPVNANNVFGVWNNGTVRSNFGVNGQTLASDVSIFWNSSPTGTFQSTNTGDTGLCRGGAGILNINDGSVTCANYRDIATRVSTSTQATLGTTSTDGKVLVNATAATSGATVQISPRVRYRGNAWDTAASQTVDFFSEVLPVSAATPTGIYKIGYQLNGGAITYPFTLTSAGVLTTLNQIVAGASIYTTAAGGFFFNGRSQMTSTADGEINFANNANNGFSRLRILNDIVYSFAIPTITSGFGTTPSIAGKTSSFRVTVGTGGDTVGVVAFNDTFSNTPACFANNETTGNLARTLPTTTQVTINAVMVAADKISVVCIGY